MQHNINNKKIDFCRKKLLLWYSQNKRAFPWREKNRSPYERLITEILLQRTQANTVANYYDTFFSKFPSWKHLAKSPIEEIGELLKPLGLWQQRAIKLKALAKAIIEKGGDIPEKREEIDALPGVGQYIGNSIELFFYNRPKPLVDVNMARVLERYFGPRKLSDIRYDPYLQDLAHEVVDCKKTLEVNFAILDFAALICKARSPLCEECPLASSCLYGSSRLAA